MHLCSGVSITMIVDNGRYYLYRHIRTDTNIPFYIGIGDKGKDKHRGYYRARSTRSRNSDWKNVVDITSYVIDIILESDDKLFINKKEKEFIKLYGRTNKNEGTLVNWTDGGEGNLRQIQSAETIEKRVSKIRGKERSAETKEKLSKINKGKVSCPSTIESFKIPILQYSIQGNLIREWKSLSDAAREMKTSTNLISRCCKGKRGIKSVVGYIWMYRGEVVNKKIVPPITKNIPVLQYSNEGVLIREYKNCSEAAKISGIAAETIRNQINGKTKMKYNIKYIWKRK